MKRETAWPMELRRNLVRQRHDRDQSESQECITVDSCFGLYSPRQYSIMPQRTECTANASQLLQSLCALCSW